MPSELLGKLGELDRRAEEIVSAARDEAAALEATAPAEAAKIEKAAEARLASALRARAEELAAVRDREISVRRSATAAELEGLKAVPEGKLSDLAGRVAKQLLD